MGSSLKHTTVVRTNRQHVRERRLLLLGAGLFMGVLWAAPAASSRLEAALGLLVAVVLWSALVIGLEFPRGADRSWSVLVSYGLLFCYALFNWPVGLGDDSNAQAGSLGARCVTFAGTLLVPWLVGVAAGWRSAYTCGMSTLVAAFQLVRNHALGILTTSACLVLLLVALLTINATTLLQYWMLRRRAQLSQTPRGTGRGQGSRADRAEAPDLAPTHSLALRLAIRTRQNLQTYQGADACKRFGSESKAHAPKAELDRESSVGRMPVRAPARSAGSSTQSHRQPPKRVRLKVTPDVSPDMSTTARMRVVASFLDGVVRNVRIRLGRQDSDSALPLLEERISRSSVP